MRLQADKPNRALSTRAIRARRFTGTVDGDFFDIRRIPSKVRM
jgi:hypothetical protein